MNKSDMALLLTTTLMIVFIATVFAFIWADKMVPDSLIYCVLGSGTAELGVCGWIYSVKKKTQRKSEHVENEPENKDTWI